MNTVRTIRIAAALVLALAFASIAADSSIAAGTTTRAFYLELPTTYTDNEPLPAGAVTGITWRVYSGTNIFQEVLTAVTNTNLTQTATLTIRTKAVNIITALVWVDGIPSAEADPYRDDGRGTPRKPNNVRR